MSTINKKSLKISSILYEFINKEVIPGTGINVDDFWNNFEKVVNSFASKVSIEFLENKNSFSEKEWKELYKISEETFVEESESLKSKGAGAGLTDND